MTAETLRDLALAALDDAKGQDLVALDVTGSSSITDWMILASGTSGRHVKSLVDRLIEAAKQHGHAPLGVEGREACEWVLVDLGDVIVHVMQAETRTFYDLERLWRTPATEGVTAVSSP